MAYLFRSKARSLTRSIPLVCLIAVGGCAVAPKGPSMLALPGTGNHLRLSRSTTVVVEATRLSRPGASMPTKRPLTVRFAVRLWAQQLARSPALRLAVAVGLVPARALDSCSEPWLARVQAARQREGPSAATTTPTSSACMQRGTRSRSRDRPGPFNTGSLSRTAPMRPARP